MNRRPRVGILGAGQLALMLAEAAPAVGCEILCAGRPGDCAEQAAPVLPVDLSSPHAVAEFARHVDLLTVESENIDAHVLHGLPLFPNARAIGTAQDRLLEKHFFLDCGLAVAPFAPVNDLVGLHSAIREIGLPCILKTRRLGYDGKGQFRITHADQAAEAWAAVRGAPCILEGMVDFETEVSLIAARNRSGQLAFYPLTENFHREGILRISRAPAHPELQSLAEQHLTHLLDRLDYIGVLAVEFFVVGSQLLANEMAPRVHNSGHWTIEGSDTSQFENHLRAILGLPLGSTASSPTVMFNCIGAMPAREETARFDSIARHDYGKSARPGRKVGHLTVPASDHAAVADLHSLFGTRNKSI
ncbi:MAG TPA: 5-(carboxyamino)imidazole ribonucleotide synthase [Candidatus Aquilonibacter sp.]|nr:5-(carboxyamino)imidazole ribonucleotide synthase [Candidatus Aquilonibacter sp.]